MNIVCVGGGPTGLYFAILMKKLGPAIGITVVERNRPDDTFGRQTFGRQFAPAFLAAFTCCAKSPDRPLLAAIALLGKPPARSIHSASTCCGAPAAEGPWTPVNTALIPAVGEAASGRTYILREAPGAGTCYYRLEDIGAGGKRTAHPVATARVGPEAEGLELFVPEHGRSLQPARPFLQGHGLAARGRGRLSGHIPPARSRCPARSRPGGGRAG